MEIDNVYKCEVCGNIVELVHVGGGELVCCGQPMKLQEEKSGEEGTEKHKPVITKDEKGCVIVKVGSVDHPMEEDHYIEWVEVSTGEKTIRKYLSPKDKPELSLCDCVDGCKCGDDCSCGSNIVSARAYCNKHGLWKSD
ncbi:MAG: desulfoferrodoxin FeS4 iron-binding domain-containing protein [Candidatus Diapherotrites archaeon]|uniref:Desulfoferrodoxin FeS4 iron-binding domain-containing protein n=1 Tax=Candidatus Iainarchaeum sp. TaxID=3101447 RepID=A0A8T5GEW9_9ARCH|nr:desulfoferrodoxin FeS4 iron-binding domain-containing protein [Candidatus Diapherotrites archaeon]